MSLLRPGRGLRPRRLGPLLPLLALLAACSGEPEPLAGPELDEALLSVDNLGVGWVQLPDSEATPDDSAAQTGCLAGAGDLSDVEPTEEAGARFSYTQGAGSLTVGNGVAAYEDPAALTDSIDAAHDTLEACTEISNETESGSMTAAISVDNATSAEEVDRQLTVRADGSLTAGGQTQDFTLFTTVAQIGPNVTTVQTIGTIDLAALHATYVAIAIDRLVAVGEGEEPAETVAPDPAD